MEAQENNLLEFKIKPQDRHATNLYRCLEEKRKKARLFESLVWGSTVHTGRQPHGREGGSRDRVRNSKSGKECLGFVQHLKEKDIWESGATSWEFAVTVN